jgi:membrane-associated phospholipid phosphatase
MKVLFLTFLLLFSPPALAGGDEWFDKTVGEAVHAEEPSTAAKQSDYTLMANVAYSIVGTAIHQEKDRWGKTATVVATHGISYLGNHLVKVWAKRSRPNDEDRLSFFSGHCAASGVSTSVVCSQMNAANCGISAALAVFTCVQRVRGKKHHPTDAAIGLGYGAGVGLFPSVVWEF